MIPESALRRTFAVRCGPDCGTGFTVNIDGAVYLFSAKHVFTDYQSYRKLEVLTSSGWKELAHRLILQGQTENLSGDFIAFELFDEVQSAPDAVAAGSTDVFIGQDVFGLGYPLHAPSPLTKANSNFLPAFARKGILSAIINDEDFGELWVLDMFISEGMSGGPVFVRNMGLSNKSPLLLGGICTSYYSPPKSISEEHNLFFKANTGLSFCVPIDAIINQVIRTCR